MRCGWVGWYGFTMEFDVCQRVRELLNRRGVLLRMRSYVPAVRRVGQRAKYVNWVAAHGPSFRDERFDV